MDEKVVSRFISVRNLARQGSPGERDNAARVQAKMESDHPGIAAEADRMESDASSNGHGETPPGVWRTHARPAHKEERRGNWEEIFSFTQSAFFEAKKFAESMANAQYGQSLASQATTVSKVGRTGNLLVTVKLPEDVWMAAHELNELQKAAFRAEIHRLLDEELNLLL